MCFTDLSSAYEIFKASEITVRTHKFNICLCTLNKSFLRFFRHKIHNIFNFDFLRLITGAPSFLILAIVLEHTSRLTIRKYDGG